MTRIYSHLLFALLFSCVSAYGQPIDQRVLDDLRKRYEHSFESIYVNDPALNNLSVHLRAESTIDSLNKSGTDIDVLKIFRKFLTDIANDRAFLQLELRALRAGYKRDNDPSATIQTLPWTQRQVFHVAVLCDRYLVGQLRLAQLGKKLSAGGISLGEGWVKLDELRRDPYVPVTTMTNSLTDFALQAEKNEAQINVLATTNPFVYNKIRIFRTYAADRKANPQIHEWPSPVKIEWINKYRILESYGKSADEASVSSWRMQLDILQDIEYRQLLRSASSKKNE